MTPLNCMIYFADMIIEKFGNCPKGKDLRKLARMIKQGGNMLKFLVKDLLDRSLIEKDMFVPSYTNQNVKGLVESICEIMKAQAIHKSVNLVFNPSILEEGEQFLIDLN